MIGALEVESPDEHSPLFETDFCGLIDVFRAAQNGPMAAAFIDFEL